MTPNFPWQRGFIAGLAGGMVWFLSLFLFFGPAQSVLMDPDLQSPKFLRAVTGDPRPHMAETPLIIPVGLLGIGVLWGWVYVWLARTWLGSWWRRGLSFAVVAWVLMVPWFEFYLPWNVLLEPPALVILEMACWGLVLITVGVTIAGVDNLLRRRSMEPTR